MLVSAGWLAVGIAEEMREAMKREEALNTVLESSRTLFSKIPREHVDAEAMGAYGRIRSIVIDMARKHNIQIRQPRTYSYKPELRAK